MRKLLFRWRKINNITTTNKQSFQHFTIKITSRIGIQKHQGFERLPAGGGKVNEVEVFMAIGLRHLPFCLCLLKAEGSSKSWKKYWQIPEDRLVESSFSAWVYCTNWILVSFVKADGHENSLLDRNFELCSRPWHKLLCLRDQGFFALEIPV